MKRIVSWLHHSWTYVGLAGFVGLVAFAIGERVGACRVPECVLPMVWWRSLKSEEARAAWVQAVGSIIALAIAVGVPLVAWLWNEQREASKRRLRAHQQAVVIFPLVTRLAADFEALQKRVSTATLKERMTLGLFTEHIDGLVDRVDQLLTQLTDATDFPERLATSILHAAGWGRELARYIDEASTESSGRLMVHPGTFDDVTISLLEDVLGALKTARSDLSVLSRGKAWNEIGDGKASNPVQET